MEEDKVTPGIIASGAVCLYFDADTDTAVRRMWDTLAEAGISDEMPSVGWRPHLTLSGCRDLRLREYVSELTKFAAQSEPLNISLSSVGYFSGGNRHTLFLAPTVTHALLDMHERHHQFVSRFCASVSTYYTPNGWTPHCTLALNLSAATLAQAVALLKDVTLPLTGELGAVGVVQVARPRVGEFAWVRLGALGAGTVLHARDEPNELVYRPMI